MSTAGGYRRATTVTSVHVLFVTRKFPPQTGGMETLAKDTHDALLAGGARVTLLRWTTRCKR